MMKMLWTAFLICAVISTLIFLFSDSDVLVILTAIISIAIFCFTVYMDRCRRLFDFKGGGVMGDIHQFLVDHFPWLESRKMQNVNDGSGLILDIGCGAGALTNRVAKTYPNARLIGMDYWGPSGATPGANAKRMPLWKAWQTAFLFKKAMRFCRCHLRWCRQQFCLS